MRRKKNLFDPPRVFLPILLSHTPCVQFVRHVAYAMYALTYQNFNALVNICFTEISMSTDITKKCINILFDFVLQLTLLRAFSIIFFW